MTVSFVATNDASMFLFFFGQSFFTDFSLPTMTLHKALISSTDLSLSRVVEVTERREEICMRMSVCFDSKILLVVKGERGWWVLVNATNFSELLRI